MDNRRVKIRKVNENNSARIGKAPQGGKAPRYGERRGKNEALNRAARREGGTAKPAGETGAGDRLEGRKAVLDALVNEKPIDKLFIKKGGAEGTVKVIKAKAREKHIPVIEVESQKLDQMAQSRNHQGVIAIIPAAEYCEISDILNEAAQKNEDPFILIVDGVTDTYNLGAIIRSACAAGAHGVVIPKRRSATLTGAVSKASAGAALYCKTARVPNIGATIDELKKHAIWVFCSEAGAKSVYEHNFSGPVALVIGGEDKGVSQLVKNKCDFFCGIPMREPARSLNASVAAGVLLFEVARARRGKA